MICSEEYIKAGNPVCKSCAWPSFYGLVYPSLAEFLLIQANYYLLR